MHRVRVVLVLTVLLTAGALAGCTQTLPPEARFLLAVERFQRDIGPDGDVNRVDFDVTLRGVPVTGTMDLGLNRTSRVAVEVVGFPAPTWYCAENGTGALVVRDTAFAARAPEVCGNAVVPLPVERDADFALVDARATGEGGVVGTVRQEGADGGVTSYEVHVGADERVTRVDFDGPDGKGRLHVAYGERPTLDAPEPDARVPTLVKSAESFTPGRLEWRVTESDAAAPLDELHVRVLNAWGAEVARFRPTDGRAEAAGFTFRFTDADEDGRLTEGDAFTLRQDGWEERLGYHVLVWDEWAGAPLAAHPLSWLR